jgi:5-amino-6-(5-phosphoribosylamino)uracil reductase
MTQRPYVLLSCCLSLDGYLDSVGDERLVLSNAADLERVDEVRASCDAILVGAGTVRADDPRLVVHSGVRRARRRALGLPATPLKVTVTSSGDLPPTARLFRTDDTLVFAETSVVAHTRHALGPVATVVDGGSPVSMHRVTSALHERGVRRLMVEGGGRVHTQFLTAGLADELQLAMAPLFVGDSRAPRFVTDGRFPWDAEHRARLTDVRQLGDVVLLRYALSDRYGQMEGTSSAS